MIDAALCFKRAVDRIVERGNDARELRHVSTWATVLDEVLATLAAEYARARPSGGELRPHEYRRARVLMERAREAADRMLWTGGISEPALLRDQIDRLTLAVRYQRPSPSALGPLIDRAQRHARQYRPSSLVRVGRFVLGQLLPRPEGLVKRARFFRNRKGAKEPHPA